MKSRYDFVKERSAKICASLLVAIQLAIWGCLLFGWHSSLHHKLLDVPLVCQLPELGYGCELTSLTMLLNYRGIAVDKLEVAKSAPKDRTELVRDEERNICVWGNPVVGYVGDITSENLGYTIDPAPILEFVENEYSVQARDLTGAPVEALKDILYAGRPVMAWVTYDFTTDSRPRYWFDADGHVIKADFNMHCVVLTGYDDYNFYYNDPLRNKKNLPINQDLFVCGWVIHGKKALCLT